MRAKSKRRAEEKYVLDAHSLLAFLEAEKGSEEVKCLLEYSGGRLYISAVNLGEVYYVLLRERGEDAAELMLGEFRQAARIRVVDATLERAREAGKLKARGGISYTDCFAAALAAEKGAWLVTGDPEFGRVADKVKILWLGGEGAALPGAPPGYYDAS